MFFVQMRGPHLQIDSTTLAFIKRAPETFFAGHEPENPCDARQPSRHAPPQPELAIAILYFTNKRRTADRAAERERAAQERHRRNGFQEDRAAAGHGRSFAAFAASSITARSASMNFPVAVLWMLWPPSTNSLT